MREAEAEAADDKWQLVNEMPIKVHIKSQDIRLFYMQTLCLTHRLFIILMIVQSVRVYVCASVCASVCLS